MSIQTSDPGANWRGIVAEPDHKVFASAFIAAVRLEMSALDEPIVGVEGVRRYFEVSRSMFDRIAFTNETSLCGRTHLEWEGEFQGSPIAGSTVLVRNDTGPIESIKIYQRPLRQVIAFSAALSERFGQPIVQGWSGRKQENNKAIVLEAFDTLFNKRDYKAAEKYWAPDYIQHSAIIGPGRNGLFALTRSLPDTLAYHHGMIVAEGDLVMVHGRFSGNGQPAALVAVDIVRLENGVLAEHWDVVQDEATRAASASGLPMFGDGFPELIGPSERNGSV